MEEKVEYRFYEMPQGLPALALTGKGWEIIYGMDKMHFHNCLEIGCCHYGEGNLVEAWERPENIRRYRVPVLKGWIW